MGISRLKAGGVVVAGVVGLIGTGAGSALAACGTPQSTAVTYDCVRNQITMHFTVTVPQFAHVGETITVQVSGDIGPHDEGPDLPADALQAQIDLPLGGAAQGTVTATGITNTDAIPLGQEILVSQGSATLTVSRPGPVTFALGTFSGSALGNPETCTVVGTPPVAAETIVF